MKKSYKRDDNCHVEVSKIQTYVHACDMSIYVRLYINHFCLLH